MMSALVISGERVQEKEMYASCIAFFSNWDIRRKPPLSFALGFLRYKFLYNKYYYSPLVLFYEKIRAMNYTKLPSHCQGRAPHGDVGDEKAISSFHSASHCESSKFSSSSSKNMLLVDASAQIGNNSRSMVVDCCFSPFEDDFRF